MCGLFSFLCIYAIIVLMSERLLRLAYSSDGKKTAQKPPAFGMGYPLLSSAVWQASRTVLTELTHEEIRSNNYMPNKGWVTILTPQERRVLLDRGHVLFGSVDEIMHSFPILAVQEQLCVAAQLQ